MIIFVQDFLPRLKNHLLGRLLGQEFTGDETEFTPAQQNSVTFLNNRLYRHKVLRINYTTYDLRRAQDSLNPRTHANVMVLAHEDDPQISHPYWYARIIGIFHAFVNHRSSPEPVHMDFLWVRWYGRDVGHRTGWNTKQLHRVGFVDGNDPQAFGFLDPSLIIRGCHLIPAFDHGRTKDLLPPSLARLNTENDMDSVFYYVNM